jgi:hypothetical protein
MVIDEHDGTCDSVKPGARVLTGRSGTNVSFQVLARRETGPPGPTKLLFYQVITCLIAPPTLPQTVIAPRSG